VTVASIPSIFYEFAFNADPNQGTVPPYWSDLSSRVQYGWSLGRGRQYELDTDEAGTWTVELANTDGALDPGNAASPYAPNVLPYRPCRIRVVLGNNLLGPDQATAGEYAGLAAGPAPAWVGVGSFVNAIATIASVGASAYQGSRVWSTTVPSGMAGADLLDVSVQQVTAGTTYTFSTQAQAVTSGQNPATYVAIGWIGANGQTLSTTSGSPTTLTGGAGTWTQLAVTGQAPAAAVAALLRVVTTTTPTANSTVWTDGLQLEARGFATRFQTPWTPGVNLLPWAVAAPDAAGSGATASWHAEAGTVGYATNLTAAPTGQTSAISWTTPSGTNSNPNLWTGTESRGPSQDNVQVTAGQSYTASYYALRAASADATLSTLVSIFWYSAAGVSLGNTSGTSVTLSTSTWSRISVTATAPAGAAWGRAASWITAPGTTTATNVIYLTGYQMEQAAAASTWADPGAPCFLFTGLVERFPRTWDDLSGTYGTSKLECVDATAAVSQYPLLSPFVQELLALSPNFLYELNEPAGATACTDTAGRRIPAPVENSPYGVGSLIFGSSITATNPPLGFIGAPGPVATFNNPNPGNNNQPATFISLHKTAAGGPPPNGNWTRIIHLRVPTTSFGNIAWAAYGPAYQSGNSYLYIGTGSGGTGPGWDMQVTAGPSGGAPRYHNTTVNVADGNWHQLAITCSSGGTVLFYVDGVQFAPTSGGATVALPFASPMTDAIGGTIETTTSFYSNGWDGDVALACELPFAATSAQMTNLYNSWRSASSGESTGARYARILKWIGWSGPTNIATGSTSSMGPATDTTGQTPLDSLNGTATTENGESYVDSAGRMTFMARSALYGVRTPQVVFGEARPVGNAGEWPVEVGDIDFDPSHLANIIQVTQYQGPVVSGTDATSIRRYYSRLYQRTVNVTSINEAQDAANYLKSQYKDPHQRADVIRAHPSAIVGLFPVLARLDKNARIRYIKRPIGAPSTTLDGFLQRIVWTWSATNDVFVEYQASPADLVNYWRIGALYTTLSAQAASGQNQATINALPDAARNKLAQSMPQAQTLWFEPGTSRFEAVTVLTIPSTSLGYSTATLTMTGNFAFTHPVGSVVCEPLQTGVTDPTTWDTSSVLGASYAPILSGGAVGTNTVTVGPLPDAAYNSLGQTWNTGDTVVLSSGGSGTAETAVIQSVSTTYPGYTSAVITFTANLANNHPAGDYVSDQFLVAGTSPATFAPTTRVTY
jgi:hypothetical protein